MVRALGMLQATHVPEHDRAMLGRVAATDLARSSKASFSVGLHTV